ncbi:MAG: DUF1131 family protein [Chitinispirillaceae bacterium]|nr:DUF1131 family protein [Chitinispirillaceae bacterium]
MFKLLKCCAFTTSLNMQLFLIASLPISPANSSTVTDTADSAGEIIISENGVGPITGQTAFEKKEIERLFPQYTVDKVIRSTEGEEFPALQVAENGEILLVINPDYTEASIFSIEVRSSRIRNSTGPGIGFTYSTVIKDSLVSCCTASSEEYSGYVICRDSRSKHIHYLFSGEYNGPDGELPPPDILKDWKIKEIIWKPR